jgi:hypothetical protein
MSEDTYRKVKVYLLGASVAGSLLIEWRWSENGRYQQVNWSITRDRLRPLPHPGYPVRQIREVGWNEGNL